jgi:phage-related protein
MGMSAGRRVWRAAREREGVERYEGAGVLEVVDDFDPWPYRAIFAPGFEGGEYVLRALEKKSPQGIATPKVDSGGRCSIVEIF